MKLLFLIPYVFVPPSLGNHNLTFNLLKYVSDRAECDLAILIDHETERETVAKRILKEFPKINQIFFFEKPKALIKLFYQIQACCYGYHPAIARYKSTKLALWLRDRLTTERYDAIHFDLFYMAQYRQYCPAIPTVLIASDAYSMAAHKIRSQTSNWQLAAKYYINELFLKNYERRIYSNFDLVCNVSPIDTQYLSNILPNSTIKTIKIAIASEFLDRPIARSNTPKLLCTFTGGKQVVGEAVGQFLNDCYRRIKHDRPQIQLFLLGRNIQAAKWQKLLGNRSDITLSNRVEDYMSFLSQDWIYIYPQTNGSGLKTKVQQAMAVGLPVVGSPEAFAGLPIQPGKQGFICHSPEEFYRSIDRLLSDRALREQMGRAASNFIRKNFSREVAGAQILELYRETIARYSSANLENNNVNDESCITPSRSN
ncbi:glycosyltransferase [Oxynema sp. CENA135]|nr:glycosyltransferase [Oxynema sp. CENA135]